MKHTTTSLLLFLILVTTFISAQSVEELKTKIEGSSGLQRAQYELQLSNQIVDSDPASAFSFASEAMNHSEGNTTITAASNALMGQASLNLKKYDDAISYAQKAASAFETSDKNNYALSESVLADAYEAKSKISEAISHNSKAYEAYNAVGKDKNAAANAASIGVLYNKQNDYKKAISWYQKAAASYGKANKLVDEAKCLQAIGAIYSNYGDYKSAQEALVNAMDVAKKSNSAPLISAIEQSLGQVQQNAKTQSESVTDFEQEKIEEQQVYIADIKQQNSKTLAEIEMLSEEVQLAELKIKAQQDEANILALENQKLLLEKDKITAEKNLEKAEKEKAEAKAAAQTAESQRLWIVLGALGLGVCAILIGLIRYRRTNLILKAKNEKISKQNDEIVRQSDNIRESIDYATRIQQTLLPSVTHFESKINESFVFLKPKDNVSGDFFWHHELADGFIVVAADCTGHGVPGAFMSIIFSSLLDQVIIDKGFHEPDQILEALCGMLTSKLMERQVGQDDFKDGMDVAIVRVHKKDRKISFSGARNGIYIVDREGLKELQGIRRSVGVIKEGISKPFEKHQVQMESGDCVFLFSDGFPDQKGEKSGKKFYYQPFKDLLAEVSQESFSEAANKLESVYENWKGTQEQLDDVMVVGFKMD